MGTARYEYSEGSSKRKPTKAPKAKVKAATKRVPKAKAATKTAPKAKTATKKASAAPTTGAYNAALAKMIDADPEDAGAWSVYADWLQSQGDPRGELAIVQERLRSNPKDKTLASAEKKLLAEHARTLVGDIAQLMVRRKKRDLPGVLTKPDEGPDERDRDEDAPPVRVVWRSGFFQQAFVGFGYDWPDDDDDDDDDEDDDEDDCLDGLERVLDVLASPAARFLTSLRLGLPSQERPDYGPLLKKLASHAALPRLRSLYVGDITYEESECSWITVGDVSMLYPALKHLRSLTLRGGSELTLGAIELPELRSLTIITGGLDRKNVAAICAAKWPKLERLELWFGSKNYGANATLKDIAPILSGKPFPKLEHLGLCNCELIDDLASAIPTAPILKQLESLDLSKGTMTETGVKALAAGKARLAHLRHLDLSDNYLGKASTLASTIIDAVRTQPQRRESNGGYRYAALSE